MKDSLNSGVLFVNLGTPQKLERKEVKKYLDSFLMDSRVIDIPFLPRFLLVKGIITPFRASKSLEKYKLIWDRENRKSPLVVFTERFVEKVKKALPEITVDFAMRYGEPSLTSKMQMFYELGIRYLYVVPLYPQYATSTYGTVLAEVSKINARFWDPLTVSFHPVFFDDDEFLEIWIEHIKEEVPDYRDYVFVFSFHGIPVRHLKKSDRKGVCLTSGCCEIHKPAYCYRYQTRYSAIYIAEKLGILEYHIAYQSRLGRAEWLQPYIEDVLLQIDDGKKVIVVPLSFVTDCLETLEELKISLKHFLEEKNKNFQDYRVVSSLNDKERWIHYWVKKIKDYLKNS